MLFTALELNLFSFLDRGMGETTALAQKAGCREPELARLLRAMERTGLVVCKEEHWYNTQVSSLFLVQGKKDYMGDFFLYRLYMRPQWETLTQKVSCNPLESAAELSYAARNLRYVAAIDTLVRQKALEIVRLLGPEKISGPLLDIGGGAGSLIRALLPLAPASGAVLFDIPEVIEAARTLYPDAKDWEKITPVAGDFRTHVFEEQFALVCMGNFLHAYGQKEARELLLKATALVSDNGILVIHYYFPDRRGPVPEKGALYDLAMMLNTFNGACHDTATIVGWLEEAKIKTIAIKDLATDSAVILAKKNGSLQSSPDPWADLAAGLGFDDIIRIPPRDVVTASWVAAKCEFGCRGFGQNLQCPPLGMDHNKTRQLPDAYTTAFLVRGAPPGKDFHKALLGLEKQAFLDGFHKALVFGAGPCPVCSA